MHRAPHTSAFRPGRTAFVGSTLALFAAATLSLGCQSDPQLWSFDGTRAALDYHEVEVPGVTPDSLSAGSEPKVERVLRLGSLPFAILPAGIDLLLLPITGTRDAIVFGIDAAQRGSRESTTAMQETPAG